MNTLRLLMVGASTAAFFATPAAADCDHEAQRLGRLDAAGIERVRIDAKAGELSVLGREGASEIRAEGRACASRERDLEEVQLRVERTGSTATIEVVIPKGGWSLFGSSPRLDLEVELPASLPLEVKDTSGSLEIHSVAALELEDSSGEIEIRGVRGNLRVRDSSGEIEIDDVEGDVKVSDSSGAIEIRDIRGSVVIERDTSGAIEIEDVTGDVVVERDGSGGIDVRRVGGDFTVERDGSGGIRHGDVSGRVRTPDDR